MTIAPMREADWPRVAAIYEEGIATGDATFDTEAPDWEEWDTEHLAAGRLVARLEGETMGWAALTGVSERCVYGGVAEVSVYVSATARGRGLGRALLRRLIDDSEAAGIWTLQAGIFPENRASVKLHESLGFRAVGTREKLGQMNGVWRDVVLMERRSPTVGV